MKTGSVAPFLVVLFAAASAQAHLTEFYFSMRGQLMIPPTDSTARGDGLLIYDHHTFNYDLDLVITGVALEDLAGAGPNGSPLLVYRALPGQVGDLVLDPGHFGEFVQEGDAIRITLQDLRLGGQQGAFSSDFLENQTGLYNGKLHFQLFTQQYPDGEIRGRLPGLGRSQFLAGSTSHADLQGAPSPIEIPTPASATVVLLLAARRRRR
jgi:hypothetical protein